MKRLAIKGIILLTPLILIVGYFIWKDPMKIVHSYESPLSAGVLMNDRLFQARWLNKQDSTDYQGFIFGSSRSKAFKTSAWQKYLPANIEVFHMGVNDESLYGLVKKAQYLDKQGFKIKHALIPLDVRLLSLYKDHEAHIFREHPDVSGESAGEFYKRFFIAFLNVEFWQSIWIWEQEEKVTQSFTWNPGFTYNKKTGDHYYSRMDSLIVSDSLNYYDRNKKEVFYQQGKLKEKTIFYTRDFNKDQKSESVLNSTSIDLLKELKATLQKHGTNYKVVLTPNYDLSSPSKEDRKVLDQVFGKEHIYDFSGVTDITKDYHHYYEEKHFKPYVANWLMSDIYREK